MAAEHDAPLAPSLWKRFFRRPMDWRYALRITTSAGLSYGIAIAIHLPEPFWAVITAIIVARSNFGGSLRSGADRLIATLAGAGLGVLAAVARPYGVPEAVLLLGVVGPLALLAAVRPEFRAGLIAGVIVLHGSAVSGSPTDAALLRVADIALGATVAILVSRFVMPARALHSCYDYSGRALKHLSDLLALVVRPGDAVPRGRILQVSSHARRAWRAAGRAANEAHAEHLGGRALGTAPFLMVRALSHLHSDIGVIGRALRHNMSGEAVHEVVDTLRRLSAEFRAVSEGVGRAMLHGEPLPSMAALDAILAQAPKPEASVSTAALTQMLGLLRADLAALMELVERQRPGAVAA